MALWKINKKTESADSVADRWLLQRESEVGSHTLYNDKRCIYRFIERGDWDARAFLAGFGASQYNKFLQTLRAFSKFCLTEGVQTKDITAGIGWKQESERIVRVEDSTIRKLLDLCDTTTYAGLRDRCIILLSIDTGIRPFEACGLERRDINLDQAEVVVRKEVAKTRTPRRLPLSPLTVTEIQRLLAVLPENWGENLFANWHGERLTTKELQWRFRGYSKKIGVTVTPYQLRHYFAVNFLKNSGKNGIFVLQKLLGHQKLEMTRKYMSLLDEDVTEEHSVSSPLKSLYAVKPRLKNIK